MKGSYLLMILLFLTIWTSDGHVVIKDGDITVVEIFTEDRTIFFPKIEHHLDILGYPAPGILGDGLNYEVPGRSFVIEIPKP